MNKPAAATAAPSYEILAVEDLRPSPMNPRRIDDKHPSLPSLADSIKVQGVLEPILVRELNEPRGQVFEILAGERRWRAARIAGVAHVPCLVRTCDDQQAFEITVTENLQREDLHWLEEARGVEMMVKNGWDAETIAKHIGKSPAWVHLRAKLATISPKWQKVVEDPASDYHKWPAASLELIARFPIAVQEDLLKGNAYWLRQCETFPALKKALDENLLQLLSSAAWDLTDAKLVPAAGACSACPKRSSCQKNLFENAEGDRCTDVDCWSTKSRAHLVRKVKELREQHPSLQLGSKEHLYNDRERYGLTDKDKVESLSYGWKAVTKDEKGAQPFYLVETGSIVWRKKQGNSRQHTGGSSSSSKAKSASPAEKLKQQRVQIDSVRVDHVETAFCAVLEKVSESPVGDMAKFLALVATFGVQLGYGQTEKTLKVNIAKGQKDLVQVVWRGLRDVITEDGNFTHYGDKPNLRVITSLCEIFGGKWPEQLKGWIAEAEKKHPEPKEPSAAAPKAKAKKK